MATEILDPGIRVKKLGETTQIAWEAFQLFGSKMMPEFKQHLVKAKEKEIMSAYRLMIGLSRLEGDKKEFEDIAVDYAVQFGESPPSWYEGHTQKRVTVGPSEVNVESFSVDTIIEVTVKMENPRPLILHLSMVKKIDLAGIELFNEALYTRLQRNEKTSLINGENLMADLLTKLKSIQGKPPKTLWDFCFNYFKLNGQKEEFDRAAKEYARMGGEAVIWKDMSEPIVVEKRRAFEGFSCGEELSSLNEKAATDFLNTEQGKACEKSKVIAIDFANVKRGSFVSAMNVSHFLKVFKSKGMTVNFINVNEIFIEMFKAIALEINSILAPGATA